MNDKPIPAKKRFPALAAAAARIRDECVREINRAAAAAPDEGMPYKAQCILEMVVADLEAKI